MWFWQSIECLSCCTPEPLQHDTAAAEVILWTQVLLRGLVSFTYLRLEGKHKSKCALYDCVAVISFFFFTL